MRVADFQGTKVYRVLPEEKRLKKDGTPRRSKKLGKIHFPVFAPDGRRVLGFMVRLPDVVGMIKQDDRFVALDALDVTDDGLLTVVDEKGSFDAAAAKRLGVSLDECLIWTGMDVVTSSGKKLGYCADAQCHPRTGKVTGFSLSWGSTSSMLVGNVEMPASYLMGYRDGAMIVSDKAAQLGFSGGVAAKAAEASVKAQEQVKKGAAALDQTGSKAVDAGSKALGRQLGRAKGMFGGFMDEYKKAAGTSKGAAKKNR